MNILHITIPLFFTALVICLFVQMILSWLPLPPNNGFVRFFQGITAPVIEPVRKRIPAMSVGMLDLSYTVAFIFVWWALGITAALLLQALPAGW